jgi:hypothetical protein
MALVLSIVGVVFAAFCVWLTVRVINRREWWATVLAAIAVWETVCLGVVILYPHTIGRVFVAVYTAYYGDIQSSYGSFARIDVYSALTITTATATVFALWFVEGMTRRRTAWYRRAIVISAWEVAVMAALVWSYEAGFPYKIGQLGWALFGPPENLYRFSNLVLPRVIAWLICTTPIALAAIWIFGRDFPTPPHHVSG